MKKTNLTKAARLMYMAIKKRSPEILTGIGIAGMVTTTVLAVKATPKALLLIEEKKEKDEDDKLTNVEVVKTTWFCYVPAVVTGGMSILCLVGANSINAHRRAALAAAYALSESALKGYREKVIESIGEKKEIAVRDAIARDEIEKNTFTNREVIVSGKGNTLCYDAISGRYFYSDIEELRKAVNELNRQMIDEMYVSLNDLYYEIGLSDIRIGNDLGWNVDDLIELRFSSQLAKNETPCLVLDYITPPKYAYREI